MPTSTHVPSPLERLVLASLPHVPTFLMRRLAARYIAGEELSDALRVLSQLSAQGHPGILDLLGEHVRSEREAREVEQRYAEASEELARTGLQAYVSVKPTHLGLALSEELALELYDRLSARCAELGLFVRVEMEDSPTTDATLRVYGELARRRDNVGIVLQARLLRTPADVAALPPRANVRLVKGIYLEPAAIAHVDADAIRRAYVECAQALFERGAFVGLATHDDGMAEELFGLLAARGLGPDRYEMQVLLGVREPLWRAWKEAGHTVRVYVPYGPEWRAYSLRRMGKNPELLRSVVRNTFGLR